MTNCSGCISLQLPLLLQDHLPQSPPAFPHAPLHCPSLFPRYRHPMSCGKCWNSPAPSSHFHCHSQSSTAAPSNPDSRTMSVQLFQTMHSHLPSGPASDPPCLSSHSHSGPCGSDLSSHGRRWQNAGCFRPRSPHINRRIRIVDEFQVFQSLCNRRIHRRIHIVDNHGMAVPLRHLKLCF